MSTHFGGGIIASLSIPWGFAKGDKNLGGYHLVWPRDVVESAAAMLAAGAFGDAAQVLRYLAVTQEADGRWPQNMWLDGTAYWHRYNNDGYGEHPDGSPFEGTGQGRAWPLLTAERAHYELAAGRTASAIAMRDALMSCTGPGGLLPEQVWDAGDLPERELFFGKPTGSAMPLVWAHAEYIKLCRSLADGRVFDLPPQTVQRYQTEKVESPFGIWRFNHKSLVLLRGLRLRIEVRDEAFVRWTSDAWSQHGDAKTRDTGLGMHLVDLPSHDLPAGVRISFTFFWLASNRWENVNFELTVIERPPSTARQLS